MINSIEIKNFETHICTKIDLHPGVNVLLGESDSGKSSVVRALEWNTKNRPQGDSYRNNQLDPKNKKDKLKKTQVSVNYDNQIVTRARNSKINHYQINTNEPLKALRTDVPEEVQNITKIKSVNIQGQHPTQQYFLLADKPGQVAKEFNKVAGLVIMDKAIADINQQVRFCSNTIKNAQRDIKEKETELKDSKWVLKAEKFAKKLTEFQSKIKSQVSIFLELKDHIQSATLIQARLDTFVGIKKAKENLKSLDTEQNKIKQKKNKLNQLKNIINDLIQLDLMLTNSGYSKKAKTALNELIKLRDEIKETEKFIITCNNKIDSIQTIDDKIKTQKEVINKLNSKYKTVLKTQGCPVCGHKG